MINKIIPYAHMLSIRSRFSKPFKLFVSGNSMYPVIQNGDEIVVHRNNKYEIGSVLVFVYESRILVHRLLKIDGEIFCCKGDNSFRIECIESEAIIGEVLLRKDPHNNHQFIFWSLLINAIYEENDMDIGAVKRSVPYKCFQKLYMV